MFWLLSTILLVLAFVVVLYPIWRHREDDERFGQSDRDAANLTIFKERLAELEAEYVSGAFDAGQFEELKMELERSLLSDVSELPLDDEVQPGSKSGAKQPAGEEQQRARQWLALPRLLPVLALLAVVPLSFIFYEQWGFRQELQVAELFQLSRQNQQNPDAEVTRDLIYSLGAVIEEDRDNGWAWYFMAQNLMLLGQYNEAGMALGRASEHIEHPQDRALVMGQWAQVQYMASAQQITPEVQDIIERTQRLRPDEPAILQLLSTDAYLQGDYQTAITYWQQMLAQNPTPEDEAFMRSAIASAQQALAARGETMTDPETSGPVIRVNVALGEGIEVPLNTRVFISAQAPGRGGPPLAAVSLFVRDLPVTVELSDADAVGPNNLSSAEEVVVVATASLSGVADVQSGDYRARSAELRPGEDDDKVISLLIQDQVP